jgi:hypothetical protein
VVNATDARANRARVTIRLGELASQPFERLWADGLTTPAPSFSDQSFEEQILKIAATIEHGEDVDRVLLGSVNDAIGFHDQLTPVSDSEMCEFRDDAASTWS